MKRMSLFLSTFLMFTLAACGTSQPDPSSNPPSSNPPSDPGGVTPPPGGGGDGGGQELVPGDANYEVSFGDDTKKFSAILADFQPATLIDSYYGGTFTNKLTAPISTVTDLDELSYVLDYCAFYKEESFEVTLDYAHTDTVAQEINKAWWNSTICPGVVGFALENVTNTGAKINFKFNNIAASYAPKEDLILGTDIIPYVYRNNGGKTAVTSVPYHGFPDLDVHNSDQLLYAVLNGYNPVIAPGSKVQAVYDKAVEIITSTLYEEMSVQEACMALTYRLLSTTSYDYTSDEASAYYNKSKADTFPDEACSTFTGGFIEGPLLYHTGFCHGMAKAGALLLALSGLDVRKVSSNVTPLKNGINGHDDEIGYWSHGYNYVYDPIAEKYVINDPTYALAGYVSNNYPGRLLRMNCGYVTVEEWDSIYHDLGEMVDDIFRTTLDKDSDLLPRTASVEWYNNFFFDETRTNTPGVTEACIQADDMGGGDYHYWADYSSVLRDGDNEGYSKNITDYINHYEISGSNWYHLSIVPIDVNYENCAKYFDGLYRSAQSVFSNFNTYGWTSRPSAMREYGALIYARA